MTFPKPDTDPPPPTSLPNLKSCLALYVGWYLPWALLGVGGFLSAFSLEDRFGPFIAWSAAAALFLLGADGVARLFFRWRDRQHDTTK